MNTKITVIYDNPQDPEAFEADYPEHLALAKKIPGIQKMDGRGQPASRGWKE